jgi:hypothetical protein
MVLHARSAPEVSNRENRRRFWGACLYQYQGRLAFVVRHMASRALVPYSLFSRYLQRLFPPGSHGNVYVDLDSHRIDLDAIGPNVQAGGRKLAVGRPLNLNFLQSVSTRLAATVKQSERAAECNT